MQKLKYINYYMRGKYITDKSKSVYKLNNKHVITLKPKRQEKCVLNTSKQTHTSIINFRPVYINIHPKFETKESYVNGTQRMLREFRKSKKKYKNNYSMVSDVSRTSERDPRCLMRDTARNNRC